MEDFSCDVAFETQVEILGPMLESLRTQITLQFSKKIKIDLSTSDWWLIQDQRVRLDFSKLHAMEPVWENFQAYFLKKGDLFVFLEEPILGIVHKKAIFWVFFDPKTAVSYFKRQTEKPKNFSAAAVSRFPFSNINQGLIKAIQEIVRNPDERVMNSIKKLESVLSVCDAYLPPDEAGNFTKTVRKILLTLTIAETRLLKSDITNPGVSPTMLDRRLEAIFRLCMRLYATRNDPREREGLRKLLSSKIIIRKKALELVEQKLEKDLGQS